MSVTDAVWAPRRPRVFFMHIPKTAGMSIRLFLGNQYPVSQVMPANDWMELLTSGLNDLSGYRLFQGHFGCGLFDLLPPDVRPVVFLREPIARTISHLKHLRRDPNFHLAHALAAGRSLAELVHDDRVMGLCTNVQTAQLANDIPGADILAGLRLSQEQGEIPDPDAYTLKPDLAKALDTLDRFHLVGFLETLQDDILRMSLLLGLHPPAMVPKSNDDPGGVTHQAEVDAETLAILRERNALDIALYDAARHRAQLTWGAVAGSLVGRGRYTRITGPTEFPMSGSIPGSNWYQCEGTGDKTYRWTGPATETTLDLPLDPGYHFELSLSVRIESLEDLGIYIEDVELALAQSGSDGNEHEISFWIPADMVQAGGLTSVHFRTRTVFRPSVADVRRLSFLVSDLQISKVEADLAPTAEPKAAVVETDALAAAVALISEREGQIEVQKRAEEGLRERLDQLQRHLADVVGSIRAPILGYVQQIGGSTGLFHDGWARKEISLQLQAERSVILIRIKGFIPRHFPELQRKLEISVDGKVSTFIIQQNGMFELVYPVEIIAGMSFDLSLRCDHDFNAIAVGQGGDKRDLAYRLLSIEIDHQEADDRPDLAS